MARQVYIIGDPDRGPQGTVISWATILDDNTKEQALKLAQHPIVYGHVALMPDAHLGIGATVGSVIRTRGGIIPAAVGVDIGCGMVAVETSLSRGDLRGSESRLIQRLREGIPSGVGKSHDSDNPAFASFEAVQPMSPRARALNVNPAAQLGTLGSGNHFAEFSVDEWGRVWAVVHSGSRGIGNQLAQLHIKVARELTDFGDASWLPEDTLEFDNYIRDMLWAQDYATANRERMMYVMLDALQEAGGDDIYGERETLNVNCHHNYSELTDGAWLTRKGAIDANVGVFGVIPGSMGTATYIVQGLGCADAYNSAPHGAGRLRSRGDSRRTLDVDEFKAQMGGRTWQDRDAQALLDEAPEAYKDIDVVMADAEELVEVVTKLEAFVCYKGVK